jgi:tol-pal system protein YbgF
MLPVLVAGLAASAGCVPPGMLTLRSGLDSLRTVVDTMRVRDSVTYQAIAEIQVDLAEQREILLSTRAATGTTTSEVSQQMERLEARLGEAMGRIQQMSQRSSAPPPAAGGVDPTQLFDQATQDLSQGRYAIALQSYRELLARYPSHELADNAQYGVGECFFAESRFDSAATEYARVEALNPAGDKVPASLYKLALSQEKLGRSADSRRTLEDLVKRFPSSGEAQLARERLGTSKKR